MTVGSQFWVAAVVVKKRLFRFRSFPGKIISICISFNFFDNQRSERKLFTLILMLSCISDRHGHQYKLVYCFEIPGYWFDLLNGP